VAFARNEDSAVDLNSYDDIDFDLEKALDTEDPSESAKQIVTFYCHEYMYKK